MDGGAGRSRWTVLALLCLARVSMSLHLQVPAAVASFLIADLGFGYAEIGLLLGLFMLPGAFIALPGGLLSDRIGDKAALLGGLALLSAGTGLLAVSAGLALAIPARLVSGAGGVLVTIQVAKMATGWFAGREVATALGCVLGTFPLGIALALATLGALAGAATWQAAVGSAAVWTGLSLALVAWLYRDPPRPEAASGGRRPPLWSIGPGELRLVLVGGLAFGLVNAAWVVFMGFTPALLVARGLPGAEANALVSWGSWISIGSIVVAGYLLDRLGRATRWLILASIVTAAACLGTTLPGTAWPWIVLFGIVSTPAVVGTLALPGEVLRPESRGTGFGVFYTVNYVGFAALPALAGYLLDVTHSPAVALWFGALLWLAIVPTLLLFRRLQRHAVRPPIGSPASQPSA